MLANLKQMDFFSWDAYHYFRVIYFQQRAEQQVIQIHVSWWRTVGTLILLHSCGRHRRKNLYKAFVEVVACSRLGSVMQEDLKRSMFQCL